MRDEVGGLGGSEAFEEGGAPLVLSFFYFFAAVLTELVNNQAVVVLLTPLGIVVGQQLGVDPRSFAVMLWLVASFLIPLLWPLEL